MDVAARSGAVLRELRHERHGEPRLLGHFLQALFEDDVPIGHLQRLGISDVQLVLPESPLAFRALDRHAGLLQMPPHRGRERLRPRALENVVVLQIPARRLQAAVLALRRLPIAVLKDVVFQLGRRDGREAKRRAPRHLMPQHRARRDTHELRRSCSTATSHSTSAVFSSQLATTSVLRSGTR